MNIKREKYRKRMSEYKDNNINWLIKQLFIKLFPFALCTNELIKTASLKA